VWILYNQHLFAFIKRIFLRLTIKFSNIGSLWSKNPMTVAQGHRDNNICHLWSNYCWWYALCQHFSSTPGTWLNTTSEFSYFRRNWGTDLIKIGHETYMLQSPSSLPALRCLSVRVDSTPWSVTRLQHRGSSITLCPTNYPPSIPETCSPGLLPSISRAHLSSSPRFLSSVRRCGTRTSVTKWMVLT
jgi:hypothetical protein